jgi:hypothetical protein
MLISYDPAPIQLDGLMVVTWTFDDFGEPVELDVPRPRDIIDLVALLEAET